MNILDLQEPHSFSQARNQALEAFKKLSISLPKEFTLLPEDHFPSGYVEITEKSSRCIALNFSQAFATYGALLSKTFMNEVKGEKDPLTLLNHALHSDGVFIYVPPGVCIDRMSFIHKAQKMNSFSRIHIVVGKGAELHVEERFGEGLLLSMAHVTCEVEEGGNVFFESVAQNSSTLVTRYSISLKENSSFSLALSQEACFSRAIVHALMQGERASFSYADFAHVKRGMCQERHSHVEHKAKETTSQKLVKRIVEEGAHSRYTGKITIPKEGERAKAHQMHRALLLGEKAICHASPLFDIFQGDVQATHGSTIAPFDEQLLFYPLARGLSRTETEKFLLQAFCDDILSKFSPKTQADLRMAWNH